MPLRIHMIQHHAAENAGWILRWAAERGHKLTIVRVYREELLPPAEDCDFLILLGGPMSVHDDLPFLREERRLITEFIRSEKPLLGICLGGQLIAQTLGANVYKLESREVGWHEVTFAEGSPHFASMAGKSWTTMHWHGEAFTLPSI